MADRQARLITKRTSVPGKIPTGTTGDESSFIRAGELASNLADHSLWGYDGTDVFEYGSNSFLGLTGGTISGDLFVSGNLSASTLFSGSTDVETIIRNLIISDTHTFVQPGSNITTGGTANNPTVNLVASPSINNLTFSGTAAGNTLSATTISGGTFYGDGSGLTNLPASSAYRTFRLTGGTTYTFTDFSLVNTLSINKSVGSSTAVVLNQSPIINEFYVVKDAKGDSKTNPITISGGTYNIDGNTAVELKAKNNPSLTFLFDGTEYIII